jgi:hypothetical protein
MSRKKIVAGNWKMNTDYNEAIALINNVFNASKTLINVEKIIFPPFPFLQSACEITKNESNFFIEERIKDFLGNRYRFPIFNLSDEFLEKVLRKFETSKFQYINGYTSSIVLFAKFLQKRNIVLKEGLSPELEALLPPDRSITIDDNNIVYLYDTQFVIDEKDIERELK